MTATANGGSGSRIYVANSTGGFLFTSAATILEVDHLTFDTGSFGSDPPYAMHWVSSTSVNVHDITCNAQFRAHKFTKCLWLTGTQKSRFDEIYSYANATGIYLDDDGAAVSSNQNSITDFHSNADTVAGMDIEGGAAEVNILNGSFQSEPIGLIHNATTTGGGFGPNFIYGSEFENITTKAIDLTAGWLDIFGVSTFASTSAIHVANLAQFEAWGGLFNGPITLDSGSFGILEGNLFTNTGTVTDNTSNGFRFIANIGQGAPPDKVLSVFPFSAIGTKLTVDGQIGFCSNCTMANPCAGSGTGAIAKRLNGVNVCN